jgi:hypothetical protein
MEIQPIAFHKLTAIYSLLVICDEKAYLFDFNKEETWYRKPQCTMKFDTCVNEKAIGCLNSHRNRNVVILPGKTENSVQIYDSDAEIQMEYDLGEIPVLLACNIHADIFAYANKKGYTINLHKIGDGTKYHSYTRGSSAADVTSIAFDKY